MEWDDEQFDNALKQAADGVIHAPGVRISAEQLAKLLDALPQDSERRGSDIKSADFRGASLLGPATFASAIFGGPADFVGAQFSDDATFDGAEFSHYASFHEAQFSGVASFARAQYSANADFQEAQFSGDADFSEAQVSGDAYFDLAQFSGDASFARAHFSHHASFQKAQFSGVAGFSEAQFSGDAAFSEAHFSGVAYVATAQFMQAKFSGNADFMQAQFSGFASFSDARFSGGAGFTAAQFSAVGSFAGVQFSGLADFSKAQFSGEADFAGVQFSGDTYFVGVQFCGDASFSAAVFSERVTLGPLLGSSMLRFDHAGFDQDVQLVVSAAAFSCRRTRFGGPANLDLRWAEVALDDAVFLQPSRLAGVGPFQDVDDSQPRCRADVRQLEAVVRPRVVSLRQANVGNLTLGNVDLRACRFFGAHGLDQLRIEADCYFAEPPRLRWYSPRRYTRRRTIAEEHGFRQELQSTRGRGQPHDDRKGSADSCNERSWYPPECQPPPWLSPPAQVLNAAQIAPLYRALRKALEDLKDEPEAADFYYGEMEMRRRSGSLAERWILWAYWLISGYGLRASRALLALAITIAVLGAISLTMWGFRPDRPYGQSLLFALQSSSSLLRAPTSQPGHETTGGQVIEIFLRLAGPLFFGLALLALRGRIKR
ncbi:MAG: pentapeptide repeat-containing protein [Solirubrobacteraceae bacterium]